MPRLEYVGGGSEKFWEIERTGASVTVRFGRIGTAGQTQVKDFADKQAATAHVARLMAEKVRKGYVEPAPAPAPASEPSPVGVGEGFGGEAEMLRELYGVAFPVALFELAAFLRAYPAERWPGLQEPLGLSTTGPLNLLLRYRRAGDVGPRRPMLLHWRFYRDLPEFFTCLHGDTDGLHYGLLLDEPAQGFRGAASYYSNDRDTMTLHEGLFDAVRNHVKERIAGTRENLEYDSDATDAYEAALSALEVFEQDLAHFMATRRIKRNERRPGGINSDTGLDLILGPETRKASADWKQRTDEELLRDCAGGDVAPALLAGRSLWYWSGTTASARAYALLSAGYETTGRTFLRKVVDVHFRHRDLRSVDVLNA